MCKSQSDRKKTGLLLYRDSAQRQGPLVCVNEYVFTLIKLTKVLEQRLYKTGAVAIETAVHVDVRSADCEEDEREVSLELRHWSERQESGVTGLKDSYPQIQHFTDGWTQTYMNERTLLGLMWPGDGAHFTDRSILD